jgi:hypothetical protein
VLRYLYAILPLALFFLAKKQKTRRSFEHPGLVALTLRSTEEVLLSG